jgi:hypothetical protein
MPLLSPREGQTLEQVTNETSGAAARITFSSHDLETIRVYYKICWLSKITGQRPAAVLNANFS